MDGVDGSKARTSIAASASPTSTRTESPTVGQGGGRGGNRSPHLRWSGAPEGTQSFALVAYQPDVPADFSDANQEGQDDARGRASRDFAHWLLVDISPDLSELPEGAGSAIVDGGKPTGATRRGHGLQQLHPGDGR